MAAVPEQRRRRAVAAACCGGDDGGHQGGVLSHRGYAAKSVKRVKVRADDGGSRLRDPRGASHPTDRKSRPEAPAESRWVLVKDPRRAAEGHVGAPGLMQRRAERGAVSSSPTLA